MNRPARIPVSRLSYEEWRLTHPPMAGGDREGDEPVDVADEMATIVAEEQEAAPEGTSGADEPETPNLGGFKLEDVDERYRDDVARYQKQVQGDYTRKTQELAQQRKLVEPLTSLAEALQAEDEDTKNAAIRSFLQEQGWEVEGDEGVDEYEDDEDTDDDEVDGPPARTTTDPELLARLGALEAEREAERREAFEARVNTHVTSALDNYKEAEGLTEVPDAIKAGIAAQLRGLDPLPDGMPDIATAITLFEEQRVLAHQAYLKSKRAPSMDLSGVPSPAPTVDLRDAKARRKRAEAVAGRHL